MRLLRPPVRADRDADGHGHETEFADPAANDPDAIGGSEGT